MRKNKTRITTKQHSYENRKNYTIDSLEIQGKRRVLKEYVEFLPKEDVTRKFMIELLGLQPFATKEEIIRELNEIL